MRIAVIPGDGIGKEVTAQAVAAVRAVSQASGRAITLEELPWGADHYLETGVTLPAGGYASPATYSVAGKQYVVIACGGGKMGTKSGDAYVAFALP